MTESIRCPNCGALAAADARWCGQCYAPLGPPARGAEPAPDVPADDPVGLHAVAD